MDFFATVLAVCFANNFAPTLPAAPVTPSNAPSVIPLNAPYKNSLPPSSPVFWYASAVDCPAAPKPIVAPEIKPATGAVNVPPEISVAPATAAIPTRLLPIPPATSPATCQPLDGLYHSFKSLVKSPVKLSANCCSAHSSAPKILAIPPAV